MNACMYMCNTVNDRTTLWQDKVRATGIDRPKDLSYTTTINNRDSNYQHIYINGIFIT